MQRRFIIALLTLWLSSVDTNGQLIRLVGVPDHQLDQRAARLIARIDTFRLRTDGVPIITKDGIINRLLIKDQNYFYGIKQQFAAFTENIQHDSLLLGFSPSVTLLSQLDSLIDFAHKGYEWPRDCDFFELNQEHLRDHVNFFPCCHYFHWYSSFRSIERFIDDIATTPQVPGTIRPSPPPGTALPNRSYYCRSETEIPAYEVIIQSLEAFKIRWGSLSAHFEQRRKVVAGLLPQRSASYHGFTGHLREQLIRITDSLTQRLSTSQAALKAKTDSIVSLETEINALTAQIRKDSGIIKKNDAVVAGRFKSQRTMDDQYDVLRQRQDSLINAANNSIRTVRFDNIDRTVTADQYNLIRKTNVRINGIAKDIAALRQQRMDNRNAMLQLREHNFLLLETMADNREKLSTISVEATVKKEEFFAFQANYRSSATPTQNLLVFLNNISSLYFPKQKPPADMELINRTLKLYEIPPPNPKNPSLRYFRGLQDKWKNAR